MKARRAALASLLLAVSFLLAGCWDMKDISDRTPIIAMGFDYLPQGMWRVTISDALLAQGGSASYSGAIHYGDGPTLTEAIEDLRDAVAAPDGPGRARACRRVWGGGGTRRGGGAPGPGRTAGSRPEEPWRAASGGEPAPSRRATRGAQKTLHGVE